MKCIVLSVFLFFCSQITIGQLDKTDSLKNLLQRAKEDTTRVKLLCDLAEAFYNNNPDTASLYAQQGLFLARSIKYADGESKALGKLANVLLVTGNYPKALENYLEKLKIEEERNIPYSYSSVVMNIGIVHALQEEYEKALPYYRKADSIIAANKIPDLDYKIALNIGDLYERLGRKESTDFYTDTAYAYFLKAYQIGVLRMDEDNKGAAQVGIGHCLARKKRYVEANINYSNALISLKSAMNEDLMCEAYLGISDVFWRQQRIDSAILFARKARDLARQDAFLQREYDAAKVLTKLFEFNKQTDSAFRYLSQTQQLRDSLDSKDRIRELQRLTLNENLRQKEAALAREKARDERRQQLQLLFIAMFIPFIFVVTLLLSRIRVNPRVIKFMGVISLLVLFEYLTLLLHPTVAELTHHTPVLEILIFVVIAAFLIPAHHRLEAWFIKKITSNNVIGLLRRFKSKRIKIQEKKIPATNDESNDAGVNTIEE